MWNGIKWVGRTQLMLMLRSALNLQQKKSPAKRLIPEMKRKLIGRRKFLPPTLLFVVRTKFLVIWKF